MFLILFSLEFRIYLDLFSIGVGEYATNAFKQKYEKLVAASPVVKKTLKIGRFTLLICTGRQRNVPRVLTHVHSNRFAH